MAISYTDQEIHRKAVFLGLIQDGEALPRHLRSKVIAALAQDDASAPPQAAPAPRLAHEIVIHGSSILVDGDPFPWLVAGQPMEISLNPDGVSTVRLTLMAGNVQVIRPEPRPESEKP